MKWQLANCLAFVGIIMAEKAEQPFWLR